MPPNISGLRVGSFACFEAHYPMWLHGILFLHLSQKTVVQVLTGNAYSFERPAKKMNLFWAHSLVHICYEQVTLHLSSVSPLTANPSTVAGFIRLSKRTREETDGQTDTNLCPTSLSTAIFCGLPSDRHIVVTSVDFLEIQKAMSLKKEESDFSSQWSNGHGPSAFHKYSISRAIQSCGRLS